MQTGLSNVVKACVERYQNTCPSSSGKIRFGHEDGAKRDTNTVYK